MDNLAKRAARAAWAIAGAVKRPPRFPPGHYYSALPNRADEERASEWSTSDSDPVGIDIDRAAMTELVRTLAPMWPELDVKGRYHPSEMFGLADAVVYHSILRHFQPAQILEIGSGFSTAVALDTIESHGLHTKVTCIEPNPGRLLALLRPTDDVQLHRSAVQDMGLAPSRILGRGDFLFIDSTHVVKAGSDVVWNVLHVLPTLQPGVIVHVHDIFWPLEYKPSWIRERRAWTEIYLLHAFLCHNPEWRVLLINDLVWREQKDVVGSFAPGAAAERPGGLWMQRI